MICIGLHISGMTSSVAIFDGGRLLYACAEERITRMKYSKYFPHEALDVGLKELGLSAREVSDVAVSWNPAINIGARLRAGFSEWPAFSGWRFSSVPNNFLPKLHIPSQEYISSLLSVATSASGSAVNFYYYNHHDCHAEFGAALCSSERQDHFVFDGYGESAAAVHYKIRNGNVSRNILSNFPHSVGMFYAALTDFLGMRPFHDEWKLMGAAAYGDDSLVELFLTNLISYDDELKFTLNLNYFEFYNFEARNLFSERLERLIGPRYSSDARQSPDKRFFNIAYATQRITEMIVLSEIEKALRNDPPTEMSITGGVAMNCKLNGLIARTYPRVICQIGYSPDDTGNAIGAGILHARRAGLNIPRPEILSPYQGPGYTNQEIEDELRKFKLHYKFLTNASRVAAEHIANGKIVAHFHGRMEFGQRALGNRSIIADPRRVDMKSRLNLAVKFREAFRPFAPAVLADQAHQWFEDFEGGSRYMEKTFLVRPEMRKFIPAVVHEDGSARIQTVTLNDNTRLYDILCDFMLLTGCPMVINTSLNINNEPIVCSVSDAIRTFFSSGIDILIIGDYEICKSVG